MENLEGGTLSLEHRYRVERYRGQHGLVARHHGLQLPFERPVWLEVYHPLADAGADPRVFERLKQSAHRAHRIDHPNVLRILDYGELDRGIPFVVSERAEGPSLADHLEAEGTLSPEEATDLADGIADALEASHLAGLSHGTLDPHWITLEGGDHTEPRVGHFRVGLSLGELRRIDGAVLTPDLLRPYPPETFDRDTIPPDELEDDHQPTNAFTSEADVYALGCIVYESLVGFHPYFDEESSDASDGIVQLQHAEPRPLEELGVDPDLGGAIHRAIARSPEDRWPSPRAFADRLRELHPDRAARDSGGPPVLDDEQGGFDDESPDEPTDHSDESEAGAAPPREPRDDELEPGGPASLLVTLTIGLLLASNVAWFFYYMNRRGDSASDSERPDPTPAVHQLRVDTKPSDAAVFWPEREDQNRTPFEIPKGRLSSDPLELELKKTGYRDSTLELEQSSSFRTVTVELCESRGE